MRVLAIAACAAVLLASNEASAACSKGMLWPYVRNAGDCLTDAEIAAGKSGVYNGPVNTAPDVSAIPPAPSQAGNNSAASAPAIGSTTQGSSGRGLFDIIGVSGLFGGGGGNGNAPATGTAGPTATTGTAATVTTPSAETGTFSCNKGYLWPFLRSAGDCLTDVEKKNGLKGVYGGGSGITPTAVSTVTAAPAGTEAPAAAGGSTPAPTSGGGTSDSPPAATCHKGLFWPFVRESGDCPTDAEKKAGSR